MAFVSLYICDICKADGYLRKAVVSYEGDNQQIFHSCKKHLKEIVHENKSLIYLAQPSIEIDCLK